MDIQSKRNTNELPLGVLLVGLGALALLGQAGIFRGIGNLLGALLFAGVGLYLVRRHYRSRNELWALCTGYGLFGLAAASITGPLSGTAFLGLTGLGFLLAYNEDRQRWWALIPAGVLFTLALVAGLDRLAPPLSGGPVFLIGLAAIFWYLNRHPHHPKRWAFYPAVALSVLALLTLFSGSGWLVSVALIAAGLYLLYRRGGAREGTLARGNSVEAAAASTTTPTEDGGQTAAPRGTAAGTAAGTPQPDFGNAMSGLADQLEQWTAAAERGVRDLSGQLGQFFDGNRASGGEGAPAAPSGTPAATEGTDRAEPDSTSTTPAGNEPGTPRTATTEVAANGGAAANVVEATHSPAPITDAHKAADAEGPAGPEQEERHQG